MLNSSIQSTEIGSINFIALFQSKLYQDKSIVHFPFSLSENENYSIYINKLFDECTTEMYSQKLGYHSVVQSNICRLLMQLLRYWRENSIYTYDFFSPVISDTNINTITEYINKHINENLLVEDLAKMCNMSYSYFAKNFRMLYGQSCKKFINSLRLCKAENMLAFTNYDLTYISQECGFSDCSHLIKLFKEKYNMTPHQYRLHHNT